MDTDPRFKKKMHYANDGTPLGYIWQCATGYDPFKAWRKNWAQQKTQKAKIKKDPPPAKSTTENPQPDYGYGKGRYMGD